MNATHSALAGVSAADKVEKLLDIDTARPYNPDLPMASPAFDGIRLEHVSYAYEGRQAALKDVSLDIPRGKVTALAGLSGSGKSTIAGLLMRFYDLEKRPHSFGGERLCKSYSGRAAVPRHYGSPDRKPVQRQRGGKSAHRRSGCFG